MTALTYRERKPTGISFVPSVPADWKVARLRNAVDSLASGGTPDTSDERYWADSGAGVPWVSIGDMTREQVIFSTEKDVTELGIATRRLEVFPVGTLLVSMYASLGKTSVLGVPATVNQAILAVRPNEFTAATFLRWWFDFLQPYLDQYSSANTQANLSAARIADLPMLLPPMRDQLSIADFLDRETAKLDALIAEQERLIALLQEKRQAVISHAVTKGLDPNVPMKDSGVEWIGSVPSHWNIARTGRAFRSIGSGSTPPSDNASYYDDNGVEWVNTGDLPDGPINSVARRVSNEAVAKFTTLREYPAGAVVIAMYGATIGKLGILTRPAVVNQACCVLSDGDGAAEPFLFYALLAGREAIIQLATGGTQPNISQATVRAFPIPVPPIEEQLSLVAQLDAELSKLDALSNDAAAVITLLRERRTALITAAVTGQIDVRGLVETAA